MSAAQEQQKTLADLYRERQEVNDEAQAIFDVAEQEQRELTEADTQRLTVITEEELPALNNRISSREKIDKQKKVLAQSRVLQNLPPSNEDVTPADVKLQKHYSVPRTTRVASAHPGLTEDEAARVLWLGGQWFRMQAFASNNQTDQVAIDRLTDAGWMGSSIHNQQVIGTDLLGGNLVPKPLAQMLVDNREQIGITRSLVDIVPMSANTTDVPKAGTGLDVYNPGEAGNITADTYDTSQVNLVAVKRATLNQISSELADDAIMSMVDRSMMEMARSFAQQEDFEFVNGDGTSGPGPGSSFGVTGLANAIGSAGVSTAGANSWAALTDDDIHAWMGLLPSQFGGSTAIICSRQFYWTVLAKLAKTSGGTTLAGAQAGLTEGMQRGPLGGTYMGVPVYFTSQMPEASAANTVHAFYGDFSMGVMLGDRTGVRIAISVDYDFHRDVMTLRGTSRYDIQVHEPGDASNAGAYVALQTAV